MSEPRSVGPVTTAYGIAADKLAIVVLSCDKYSDLWAPFAHCFRRFWPDCPFPVYLFANQKRLEGEPGIATVLSGEDRDWSSSIKSCLQQVREEYVLVLFDDVFLSRRIEPERLALLLGWLAREKPSYLRFRDVPRPDERVNREIGRYRESTMYRTAVFALWRRETFLTLLTPGESAWQFEFNGLARAAGDPAFYGTYCHDVIPYVHGVEKGKWVPAAHHWLVRLGAPLGVTRPVMGRKEMLLNRFAHLREFFFNHAPPPWRPRLIRASRGVRSAAGALLGRRA
jgi:hypothetical protein